MKSFTGSLGAKKYTITTGVCLLLLLSGGVVAVLHAAAIAPPPKPPQLSFEYASWTVSEDDGTATISVLLTGEPTAPVSVHFKTTTGGSAKAGSDYKSAHGVLEWLPEETGTVKTFKVKIKDNHKVEGTETVNLVLSQPVNAGLVRSTAVLEIVDDDALCPK